MERSWHRSHERLAVRCSEDMNHRRENDVLATLRIQPHKLLDPGKEGVLPTIASAGAEDLALLASQGAAHLLGRDEKRRSGVAVNQGAYDAGDIGL